jgi:hypothetical protein
MTQIRNIARTLIDSQGQTIDADDVVVVDPAVVDTRTAGADATGATDSRTVLNTIGNASGVDVRITPGTYRVNSDLTVANRLRFDNNAKLRPASGVTITLSGGFEADDFQHVFDLSLGGSVVVSNRAYTTPENYGAAGDGSTDDADAIQASFDSGASGTKLLSHYRCDSTITLPLLHQLDGVNTHTAILDFTQTTHASLTDGRCLTAEKSTLTDLGSLSANVVRGGTQMTFTSAPTLSVNDWLILWDGTEDSWAGFRPEYHSGECVRVASVSGSTVTIQGSFYDDYDSATVDVFKVNTPNSTNFSNFTVLGLSHPTESVFGITLQHLTSSKVDNVRSIGAARTAISLRNCYGLQLNNVEGRDDHVVGGIDYGLAIAHCQDLRVYGGVFSAGRHGQMTGGSGESGDVINRNIKFLGSSISTSGTLSAADCHGNSEFVTWDNCTIDGGINAAGDHIHIKSNTIRGTTRSGNGNVAINFYELRGCNITITDNYIEADKPATARGCVIDIAGNTNAISVDTVKGGMISIADNTFSYRGTENVLDGIRIYNRGYTGAERISVAFTGNTLEVKNDGVVIDHGIRMDVASGNPWEEVVIDSNAPFRSGFSLANTTAISYENVRITNNSMKKGYQALARGVRNLARMAGNTFEDFELYCGIIGDATTKTRYTSIVDNEFIDVSWRRVGATSLAASVALWRAEKGRFQNNTIFSKMKRILVDDSSGIAVGDVIIGRSSGATATIVKVESASTIVVRDTISGTFSTSELIDIVAKGGAGAGVATTSSAGPVYDSRSYADSFLGVDDLYRDHNVKIDLTGTYTSAITNDNTVI